jgi:hypothetical protein
MAARDENRPPVLTIVGGQPSKLRKHEVGEVPSGIEGVLGLAARDAEFMRRLVVDRDAALETSGIALTGSERAALAAVPASGLEAMVAGFRPRG